MANVVGKRYRCTKCGSEFIVTKGGGGTVQCCSQPMEQKKQLLEFLSKETRNMANQLGKRYRCAKCGTEVLCTKAGTGDIICCGEPMKTQEAKPIPSSD